MLKPTLTELKTFRAIVQSWLETSINSWQQHAYALTKATLDQEIAKLESQEIGNHSHQFYITGDADAPTYIKDQYNNVVLNYCKVCNGFETATLPLHCPGQPLTEEQKDLIISGRIDFVNGAWKVLV